MRVEILILSERKGRAMKIKNEKGLLPRKLDGETDYMTKLNHALVVARHYGIGQFRRLTGKKSKNAARCGIIKVKDNYKEYIKKEKQKRKVNAEDMKLLRY